MVIQMCKPQNHLKISLVKNWKKLLTNEHNSQKFSNLCCVERRQVVSLSRQCQYLQGFVMSVQIIQQCNI